MAQGWQHVLGSEFGWASGICISGLWSINLAVELFKWISQRTQAIKDLPYSALLDSCLAAENPFCTRVSASDHDRHVSPTDELTHSGAWACLTSEGCGIRSWEKQRFIVHIRICIVIVHTYYNTLSHFEPQWPLFWRQNMVFQQRGQIIQ